MIEVTAIKLPETFDTYKNTAKEKAEFLEPVSKINIFVGSNNSGKSRFMRELSLQSSYEVKISNVELEGINSEVLNFIEKINEKFEELKIIEVTLLNLVELKELETYISNSLSITEDKYRKIRDFLMALSNYKKVGFFKSQSNWEVHLAEKEKEILADMIRLGAEQALKFVNKVPVYSSSDMFHKVYIPTLRGLRPLDDLHTDFYLQRTIFDYFKSKSSEPKKEAEAEQNCPEIFSGLSFYQSLTDLLLGNSTQRKLIDKFQKFISEKLFEGKPVELIPKQKEKVVFVKIGSEKEQPIHHLGDGIQSAIILSFLPFVRQEQTFFFIEEPEMFLHPGLQRKLLDFYTSPECKNHTFFMTTHSNHFLDITIDIKDVSIFTFRKILDDSEDDEQTPNFTIEAVDSGHESSLELLGVRNSSVFLVNATIWVEGITDRWYLRKMLNSYMDFLDADENLKSRLEEDVHYSFVEYGGSNITHWSFLDCEEHPIEVERLCAKAMVVIDGDGEGKMKRKVALRKILGERLIILPCWEVENLLPYDVIKQVVNEYEKDEDLNLKEFNYEQYKNEYLGKFIEDKMLKKNPKRKGGYKADSGTLKNKIDFCEKSLDKIKFNDLPESTKTIIQQMYEFICSQNL